MSNPQTLAFCFITRPMLTIVTSAAYWKPCLTVTSASLPTGPTFPRNVSGLKWCSPDRITQTIWLIPLSLISLLITHLINQRPDYQLLPTGKILFVLSSVQRPGFCWYRTNTTQRSESENSQNHPACVCQPEDQSTPEITRRQTTTCKPTIPCLPIWMWPARCRLCWLYTTALTPLLLLASISVINILRHRKISLRILLYSKTATASLTVSSTRCFVLTTWDQVSIYNVTQRTKLSHIVYWDLVSGR